MTERWASLDALGFPDYSVSTWGRIRKDTTGRQMAQSRTNSGLMKVALVGREGRSTLEVSRLVAAYFLLGQSDLNNSIIHLDGNKEHTFVDNLAWRPRWFSLQYHKQFQKEDDWIDASVLNVTTGEVFKNSHAAVVAYGILAKHLRADLVNQRGFFPHGHIYRLYEE